MAEHITVDLKKLAAESKAAFAAGDFKTASRILREINELNPHYRYIQTGDGTVHYVTQEENGTEVFNKRTQEFETKALE